jgi:hypothetical protein
MWSLHKGANTILGFNPTYFVICLKNNGNPIKMIWENGIGYLERSFFNSLFTLYLEWHYIWIYGPSQKNKKNKQTNK